MSALNFGVTIKVVIAELKNSLARRPVIRIIDENRTPAAVLVPIFIKNGQYFILFIQRTDKVRHHKNQISFPGGVYKKEDDNLQNTALREAEEEIGLARGEVRILGELDDIATVSTKYVISPFVGLIPCPYQFKVDYFETEEIIEIPIKALLEKECVKANTAQTTGQEPDACSYHYEERIIWGVTARILKQFLEIISELVKKT